jgi:hypothetical protein
MKLAAVTAKRFLRQWEDCSVFRTVP